MLVQFWNKDIIKQTKFEENYYQRNKGQKDAIQ